MTVLVSMAKKPPSELDAVVWKQNLEVPIPSVARCSCGEMSRCVGDLRYFTEEFKMYSYTVECGRCGEVTVECRQ